MNKAELIAEIQTNGYTVLQERAGDTESEVKHWAVAGILSDGNTGTRKWFHFYENTTDGTCLWADKDPFYVAPVVVTFRNQLDAFIQSKINAGDIMAAFVEDIDEKQETAIARAVQDVNGAILEKRYFLNKDASGNLKITALG